MRNRGAADFHVRPATADSPGPHVIRFREKEMKTGGVKP